MTITVVNDTVTYKSARGDADTVRPADLVVTIPSGTAASPSTGVESVQGNAASGATDSGNPVKVGGRYNSTLPTLTDGQRGDLQVGTRGSLNVTVMDMNGTASWNLGGNNADGVSALGSGAGRTASTGFVYNGTTWDRTRGTTTGAIVIPPAPWVYAAATGGIDNTGTAVTIKAAGAAGVKNYVTQIQIAHATLGASTELAIRDGAGGTVLWRTLLHTTAMPTTTFDVHLMGTAATLLEVVTLTAVTGDVLVNVQGYTGP